MSEPWNVAGTVHVERLPALLVVRVVGNLHDDLAPAEQEGLSTQLNEARGAKALFLDLSNIRHLNTWGEDLIANLVDDVVANEGRVAIHFDSLRPHQVRPLRLLLERHEDLVDFGNDEPALRAKLGDKP